jgi:hypothetical protein
MEQQIARPAERTVFKEYWRHLVIALIVFGSLAVMLSQTPFAQDQDYHNFADKRGLFGIPNFGDVASNLLFFLVGLAGITVCVDKPLGRLESAWFVTFAGIALVGVASSYYHWTPNDYTLVWDRMSLTIGFTGLFIAILGEYISEKFRLFLVPAVLLGVASVLYWNWFQDLRFYYWIQMVPLIMLPFVMLLYPAKFTHQSLLLTGAVWYGLAKLAELGDRLIFSSTQGLISGHTIKHILAGVGCFFILLMLHKRRPVEATRIIPAN